jgi:hypothetical protein
MTKLPKFFLTVSLTTFALGTIVCFTSLTVHPSWMVAMPLGAVFFGLFLNAYMLQSETAIFDEEEARKRTPRTRNIADTPVRNPSCAVTLGSIQLRPESTVLNAGL